MTIEIKYNNTWQNITDWISYGGMKLSRNDVDSNNSGRDSQGVMHRKRVAIKEKTTLETIPLNSTDAHTLLTYLEPQTISVRLNPYPRTGTSQTFTAYSNNVSTEHVQSTATTDYWKISFPIIEI